MLREHFERVLQHPDPLLFHDDLADVNTPVYFYEFMEHAARHELQFLSEARLRDSQLLHVPDEVADALRELPDDVLVREQYIDFVVNRMFRQTLLCHADVELDRVLEPTRLESLWFAGLLRRSEAPDDEPVPTFTGLGGARFHPHDALVAEALVRLEEAWPAATSYAELTAGLDRQARALLGRALLEVHAAGLIDVHSHPPAAAAAPAERPTASALARRQASEGSDVVTSLRHGSVRLEDPLAAYLLTLLDGTRDRSELLAAVRSFAGDEQASGFSAPPESELPGALDAALRRLAELSLLSS